MSKEAGSSVYSIATREVDRLIGHLDWSTDSREHTVIRRLRRRLIDAYAEKLQKGEELDSLRRELSRVHQLLQESHESIGQEVERVRREMDKNCTEIVDRLRAECAGLARSLDYERSTRRKIQPSVSQPSVSQPSVTVRPRVIASARPRVSVPPMQRLINAARVGNLQSVMMIRPEVDDGCLETAIRTAVEGGHGDVVDYLVSTRSNDCPPLQIPELSLKGRLDLMQRLYEQGVVHPNEQDLERAIKYGHQAMVKWLIEHAYELGFTPDLPRLLRVALQHAKVDLASTLIYDYGVGCDRQLFEQMIEERNETAVRWFMAICPDIVDYDYLYDLIGQLYNRNQHGQYSGLIDVLQQEVIRRAG